MFELRLYQRELIDIVFSGLPGDKKPANEITGNAGDLCNSVIVAETGSGKTS